MSSDGETPYGLNEVDEFASKKQKLLLKNSTLGKNQYEDESDLMLLDDEEDVMGISDEESTSAEDDDDENSNIDKAEVYKKVFGRRLDEDYDNDKDIHENYNEDEEWGSTKNEYYGGDEIDDAEDAKEVEKEALRLQKKHLEELNMQDYLDDEIEDEWIKEAKNYDVEQSQQSNKQDQASASSIKNISNMTEDEKKSFLKMSFPEYFPLAKEYTKLTKILGALDQDETQSEVIEMKKLVLNAYLGTVASYFSVFISEVENDEGFTSMKEHPVMESILTLREVWRQVNELPNISTEVFAEQEIDDDEDLEMPEELDEAVFNTLDTETPENKENVINEEENAVAADGDISIDIDVTKSRLPGQLLGKDKNTNEESGNDDDFAESEIFDVDAQEKKARKKTLRFYTSKIDQQSNKKMEKFGGDEDIPYKERLYERQQRLMEEARKRGLQKNAATELNGNTESEDDVETTVLAKNIKEDFGAYYDKINASKKERKANRIKLHKDAVKAAREGKLADLAESVVGDGKRAINYQILKNKGLTPKRKKDNRNSRVKKRKKYEKAQKKLKSVRAVYSGGQGGSYEGEKTGIKKNLTRSIKFKN
ncbi:related to Something about silencing protein 10 [Saccharomycodes ludwigii]|uniref:Related to Something about silencing protein 10 n=1 Tax=Saccharomycodes ludwigii TaxID=36035 RepID=A0A376BA84_9ASCO|nr:related to Something about silencing protein 10 [Saccharomycodes ludwigii]